MERLLHDVRYAIRQLRRAPGYSLTAILTLALGIGAITAIFTLVHAILLRSLPVANPEKLYRVGSAPATGVTSLLQGNWGIFSHDLYQYFRDNTPEFVEMAGFQSDTRRIAVRRAGSPETTEVHIGQLVSGN